MPRYITIPASPIHLVDDLTDGPHPTEPTMEVSHAFRVLFRDPRIGEALISHEAFDLRSRLITAKTGAIVQISKEEHAALLPCVEKPRVFGLALLYSLDGQAFLRAVIDAPEKPPINNGPVIAADTE